LFIWVQSAFGTVVLVVCGVGTVGAVASLLLGGRTWEEDGKSHLLLDSESPRSSPSGSGASLVERDTEIREMLEARNVRRRRRGEPEVEIESELARLVVPRMDDELRAEIRDIVLARHHRRTRQGKPPLDVESEVERQVADLSRI